MNLDIEKQVRDMGLDLAELFGSEVLDKIDVSSISETDLLLPEITITQDPLVVGYTIRGGEIFQKAKNHGIEIYKQATGRDFEIYTDDKGRTSFNPFLIKSLQKTDKILEATEPSEEEVSDELDILYYKRNGVSPNFQALYNAAFEVGAAHTSYFQFLKIMFGAGFIIGKSADDVISFLLKSPGERYEAVNIKTNFEVLALSGFGIIGNMETMGIYPALLILDEKGEIQFHEGARKFLMTSGERYAGGCPVSGISRNPETGVTIILEGLYKYLAVLRKVIEVNKDKIIQDEA
jgi:hypothetical protein